MQTATRGTIIVNTVEAPVQIDSANGIKTKLAFSNTFIPFSFDPTDALDAVFYASDIVDFEAQNCHLSSFSIFNNQATAPGATENYLAVHWSANDPLVTLVTSPDATVHYAAILGAGASNFQLPTDSLSRTAAGIYNHIAIYGPVDWNDMGDKTAWTLATRTDIDLCSIHVTGCNITTISP